ncbi:MAG: glycosyltransferase family 39 protein [Thermoleophilaceae bacterium]
MPRRRLALLLLVCALAGSTALRVAGGADKQGFSHDESISVLAAACHQGDYTRVTSAAEPPFGRWVPASEWKALMRPDRPFCLGEIGRDLAREDIHPPFYFWLLHGWTLVFGVGLWTGLSLNIVLAALTTLALFGLGRRVLGDPLRAAAVAAVWAFSPAAIRVFAEARQYELLALLAVLFVWQCVRFCDPSTRSPRRDALGLAALAAAGALAQFLFGLVVAAGAALLVARLWPSRRRLLAWGLASIAAGYAVFSLLHPEFLLSLRRAREQAGEGALALLPGRAEATVDTLAELVIPPLLARGWVAYAACALLAGMTVLAIRVGSRARMGRRGVAAEPAHGERDRHGARLERLSPPAMALVFAGLAAAHAVLFLSFLSPVGAMDFKHLSAVWPFAAFVPVLAIGALPRRARVPAGVVGGTLLAAAGAIAALGHYPASGPTPALERADAVLIDNVARGVLPRVVWRLRDDTRVFAADQRHLLANPRDWLDELDRGDVFVGGLPASDPRYGNGPELGRRVAAAISERHRLRPLPDPLEPGFVFGLQDPLRSVAASPRRARIRARM